MWEKFRDQLKGLTNEQQLKLYEHFLRNLITEREAELPKELMLRAIEQHARIVDIELNVVPRNSETMVYEQPLQKGQVIHAKFIGLGEVLDAPHYAVIWDVNVKAGHVVVIPLSSKKRHGTDKRNIGVVEGISQRGLVPTESLAKVDQMTTISRKAIHILTLEGSDLDATEKKVPVLLSDVQIQLVDDLFRTRYLNEPTLYDVIMRHIRLLVPVRIPESYLSYLSRPVSYILIGDKLYFKCGNNAEMKTIELVDLGFIKFKVRSDLIRSLLSDDAGIRTAAEESISGQLYAATSKSNGGKEMVDASET
ncbi:type II toxin-antitoxin system PemK/MazF family toxin [Paenibacillus cremeus]|uniref:Type II toxin-antitoxin system PemK/MazF family toxin n=1 Tax=Paenibacillus cremeus TaxID=2163881 RepID=A0A559K349_9BACL|nr:type II toxin-antitoxin system PemK/MazF family toxin [Paenibacillus cremeus]TVY06575.1 type II toxin-antitoxin system PemK/MazF family toxin [Paenibacillus cremeus]